MSFGGNKTKITKIFLVLILLLSFVVPQNTFAITQKQLPYSSSQQLAAIDSYGTIPAGLGNEQTESIKAAREAQDAKGDGGFWDSLADKIIKGGISALQTFLQKIAGAFLALSGKVLDIVINYTILGINDSNGESFNFIRDTLAIQTSWEILRDLVNILFIFGLLFVSIKTIVSGFGGANTKKMLAGIIASAVLINFSYFFTTVLIDTSNFLTAEMYEQLGTCVKGREGTNSNRGVSFCFMDQLNMTKIFDDPEEKSYSEIISTESIGLGSNPETSYLATLVAVIISSLFIVILAFVFLTLAIMLSIRFITIVFLLITSPVMFLGLVFPFFNGLSKSWFTKLTSNLVFPPLAFLFLLITLSITRNFEIGTSGAGVVLNFVLIIGFTVGSILIAKTVGITSGSFATAKAGNLMFGGAAKLGRTSLGRLSNNLADRVTGTGVGSMATRNALKSIGNKSFDARNTKVFSGVAKATNIKETGTPESKGFTQLRDARRDAKVERRKSEYQDVGKQTTFEKRKIAELESEIKKMAGSGGKTLVENRADYKKDIEDGRQELNDLNSQLRTLDKDSNEYKSIAEKASEVAKKIQESKDKIKEIDTKIKESSQANEIKEIRGKGKDRQSKYLERISKKWTSLPSSQYAGEQIKDELRSKDAENEELDKIIKRAYDPKDKKEEVVSQSQNTSTPKLKFAGGKVADGKIQQNTSNKPEEVNYENNEVDYLDSK